MDKHKAIIEILEMYKMLEAEIRDLEYRIEELESIEQIGITAINYDKERISKTYKFNSIVENTAISIADEVKLLQLEKIHKEILKKRIDNALNALNDDEKQVVILKFVEKMQWFRVSMEVCKSERSCKRIVSNAFEKLENILFENGTNLARIWHDILKNT